MAKVYIGTSGWMYDDWSFDSTQDKLNYFYPPKLPKKKWLEYYSQHFKTVEINATFYHSMKPATFENWAKTVPGGFVFAVKASRFITHIKRLAPSKESLETFFESVSELGNKLGPILFQCPPRWKVDEKRLEDFLVNCSRLTDFDTGSSYSDPVSEELPRWTSKLAFEFRDPSWFSDSVYKVLAKYNCALVIAESGGYWPSFATSEAKAMEAKKASAGKASEEVITADFTYIRFHGEGGSYATSYTDNELKIWAQKIKKWQRQGIDVYAYFNNDVSAFAIENAKSLINLVH